MAATIKIKNNETGEVRWAYTVDAKEIMGSENSPWIHTGEVKNSGAPTPSRATRAQDSAATTKVKGLATEVVEALAAAGALNTPAPTLAPATPGADMLSEALSPDTVEVGSTTDESPDTVEVGSSADESPDTVEVGSSADPIANF